MFYNIFFLFFFGFFINLFLLQMSTFIYYFIPEDNEREENMNVFMIYIIIKIKTFQI